MSPSPVVPQIVGDVAFTKSTPEEGETTAVTCRWTGQPEPTVTWYKDGEKLVEADFDRIRIVDVTMGRELQIEDVKLSDTGNYVCNVSNAAGFDYQTTTLEVQALPDDTCVYLKYNIIVRVCTYISLITQQAPPLYLTPSAQELTPSAQELVLSLDSPYLEYLCWLGVWL